MRTRHFLVPLALAALLGCEREPATQLFLDLAADLAEAEILVETGEFRIGTEGGEPELGAGWSYGEVDRGRKLSFRWGTRPRSELAFVAIEPRPLTLILEGLAAPGRKAAQTVAVEINARPAGSFEVAAGLVEYRIPLAAELLRHGRNHLSLIYDGGREPAQARANDRRHDLAIAWYRVAFDGMRGASSEPHANDRRRIFLPFGSRIAFPLKIPDGARLSAERLRLTGRPEGAAGRLEIGLEIDGSARTTLASLGDGGAVQVTLGAAGQPALVTLAAIAAPRPDPMTARGDPATADRAGFLLESPAIFAPVPAAEAAAAKPAVRRPNIIVYLADTLRSDRLGCYGHDRDVSPNIDRFAAGATLFENARAQASWTLPAVTSLFTGVWPPSHGVVLPSGKLPEKAATMAEILQAAGYATSAVVANGFVHADWGLGQGFDSHLRLGPGERDSRRVYQEGVAWLESRDRSRPFFLYLHTLEPHNPYVPREEYRQRFAPEADEVYNAIRENSKRTRWDASESTLSQLFALYDALIAQNDTDFGRTLDYLRQEGLFEDSIIIFLADHGEEFYEHRAWIHGSNLFGPTLNVPLIVKLPRQTTGRRVSRVAQQVDVLPTLLDYLDLEPPDLATSLQGRSLLPDALGADVSHPSAPVFSHTSRYGRETRSVIDGDWKYIERLESDRTITWLFARNREPGELRSRAEENPIRVEVLRRAIGRELLRRGFGPVEEAVLDETTREDLRALGYIE